MHQPVFLDIDEAAGRRAPWRLAALAWALSFAGVVPVVAAQTIGMERPDKLFEYSGPENRGAPARWGHARGAATPADQALTVPTPSIGPGARMISVVEAGAGNGAGGIFGPSVAGSMNPNLLTGAGGTGITTPVSGFSVPPGPSGLESLFGMDVLPSWLQGAMNVATTAAPFLNVMGMAIQSMISAGEHDAATLQQAIGIQDRWEQQHPGEYLFGPNISLDFGAAGYGIQLRDFHRYTEEERAKELADFSGYNSWGNWNTPAGWDVNSIGARMARGEFSPDGNIRQQLQLQYLQGPDAAMHGMVWDVIAKMTPGTPQYIMNQPGYNPAPGFGGASPGGFGGLGGLLMLQKSPPGALSDHVNPSPLSGVPAVGAAVPMEPAHQSAVSKDTAIDWAKQVTAGMGDGTFTPAQAKAMISEQLPPGIVVDMGNGLAYRGKDLMDYAMKNAPPGGSFTASEIEAKLTEIAGGDFKDPVGVPAPIVSAQFAKDWVKDQSALLDCANCTAKQINEALAAGISPGTIIMLAGKEHDALELLNQLVPKDVTGTTTPGTFNDYMRTMLDTQVTANEK